MDVRLPGQSGVDVLEAVRRRGVKTPVVLITTFDDDDTFFRAVHAGANGFIRKDSSLAELTSCIEKVITGERVFRPSVTCASRIGIEAHQPRLHLTCI
jgi:DNA-binding NarL/FixJ family response regulator